MIGISCGVFYAANMPLIGALVLQCATILDRCDGDVARIRLRESKFGQWFDTALDQISYFSMFLGISICLNNPKFFFFTPNNIYFIIWISVLSSKNFLSFLYIYFNIPYNYLIFHAKENPKW